MKPHEKIKQAQSLLQEAHQELSIFLKAERSRRRGEALRQVHAISNMLSPTPLFFSQAGQDRMIDRLLNGKRDGVFVDVGGYDGVTGSNTLFFEVFRNWTGILVEASPTQLELAKAARKCPCLDYAVAGKTGQAQFMEITAGYTQMSGFLECYDADLLAKVRANPQHKEVVHNLSTKTLQSILDENNLKKIDFLSLDVEGGEMDILANFPFDKYDIDVFSIENNAQSSDLPQLMKSKGYDLVEFVGVDDIYRKTKT
ncbi:MAG: FkbM family methyltransferase [Proteobacteria bacterium]|nr:FkbM family methyltransferase [Pseudomonadota bacterium]